jgi:hypothetical protein
VEESAQFQLCARLGDFAYSRPASPLPDAEPMHEPLERRDVVLDVIGEPFKRLGEFSCALVLSCALREGATGERAC